MADAIFRRVVRKRVLVGIGKHVVVLGEARALVANRPFVNRGYLAFVLDFNVITAHERVFVFKLRRLLIVEDSLFVWLFQYRLLILLALLALSSLVLLPLRLDY